MLGNFAFLSSDFSIFFSGMPSECQTVWMQIRLNVLSGLIWVQTVYIDYQQTTLVGKELIKMIVHGG